MSVTASVRDKVKFYERLFAPVEEVIVTGKKKSIIIPQKIHVQKISIVRAPSMKNLEAVDENKENESCNISQGNVVEEQAHKVLGSTEKIHKRTNKHLEREESCRMYKETPVEFIKEEREIRHRKIELLEEKVKSVRKQHRCSVMHGDVKKAESLLKQLHKFELKLARETDVARNTLVDSVSEISEEVVDDIAENDIVDEFIEEDIDITESDSVMDEFSEVVIDDTNLCGDLWGGIVEVMAAEYCVDSETTWRTFSSYSINETDTHSELVYDNSSLDELSELLMDEEVSYGATERKNRNIFAMYDKLENELIGTNHELTDTRTELAGFRAQLYTALSQLAQNEYQVRVYEAQLMKYRTDKIELEQQIERQNIIIAQQQQHELEQEIKFLREETLIRKQQVDEIRKQIRQSMSCLPREEQSELRQQLQVEDPFIECSIRLLDSEDTPIQRISVLKTRLSSLSSCGEIRIMKPKKSK